MSVSVVKDRMEENLDRRLEVVLWRAYVKDQS